MYKTLKLELLQIEGVKPTLAELEKFEDNPDSVDIEVNEISSKVIKILQFCLLESDQSHKKLFTR